MLNHIALRVKDLDVNKKFFSAALAPLGYKLMFDKPTSAGFGTKGAKEGRDFWIKSSDAAPKSVGCIAFSASSKEVVDEFYRIALAAGGKDNGAPGFRTKYHAGYYAAFVLSPDGYNIEAVFEDWTKVNDVK